MRLVARLISSGKCFPGVGIHRSSSIVTTPSSGPGSQASQGLINCTVPSSEYFYSTGPGHRDGCIVQDVLYRSSTVMCCISTVHPRT